MIYNERDNSLSLQTGDVGWPAGAENTPDSVPLSTVSQLTHHDWLGPPEEITTWPLDPDLVSVPPAEVVAARR